MIEKERKQELNTQENKFTEVCAVTGYHTLPVKNGLPHLIRPLYQLSPFSRFHLIITKNDSRVDAELHFDIRKHRGMAFGVVLSEELDRLVKIIVTERNLSSFSAQLLDALKTQALFGASEAKKRRDTARRIFSGRIKKKKMKGENRAKFLQRRYSLDEFDQANLE